jgi:choline dehydrogenase-like flavoprotein
MQIDITEHKPRTEPFRAQVCILGAGIVGLTLAHRLAGQGIDVALLEAGGLNLTDDSQFLLTQAQLQGEPHAGTHEGRFRAFGGASPRWGGQLYPMPSSQDPAWPIPTSVLEPYYRAAEQLLAVDDFPYAAAAFFAAAHTSAPKLLQELPSLDPRLSKWVPFSQRNMAANIGRALLTHPRVTVYLNAQGSELLLHPTRSHLEAVLVRTQAGHTFRFEAPHFVLAAGTVETSRLLLASRSVAPEGVGNQHDQVGRNFHDHLSIPAAVLTGRTRATLLNELRPWIVDGTLHSLKLEATPELREELGLNPVLAHIAFAEPEDSGLAIVRDLLIGRQRGDFAATLRRHAAHLPAALVEAARLGWDAKLQHRRYISPRTTVSLRLNTAQDAPSISRITLSDELDPFGIPQPRVDWRITANEHQTLRRFATHLRRTLEQHGLGDGVQWQRGLLHCEVPLEDITDARHAMGGACMGSDPQTSVTDANLQVHGVRNLHIASAATFPTGSPQLVTLPLMALTLRLADRLTSSLL